MNQFNQFSTDLDAINDEAKSGTIAPTDLNRVLHIINSQNTLNKSLQSNQISAEQHAQGTRERHFWWERDRSKPTFMWKLCTNVNFITQPDNDTLQKSHGYQEPLTSAEAVAQMEELDKKYKEDIVDVIKRVPKK